MHIGFRHRVMFLTPKRVLDFLGIMGRDCLDMLALHLTGPDVDYHEKQHWAGVLKLCGIDGKGEVDSPILEVLAQTQPASALYWRFVRYFLQIFIGDEPLLVKLEKCGWCLTYLALWRWCIRTSSGRLNFTTNFLSDQTFVDSVIAISCFILFVKLLRDTVDDEEVLEALRLLPSYLSSRFLEYLFGFCRSEHRNATSFGAYSGKIHVDHYLYVTLLEFRLGAAAPTSKRQVSKGPSRIEWAKGTIESVRSIADGKFVRSLNVGGRRLLQDTSMAHPNKRASLPSLAELKATPLLSETSRKNILKGELTIEGPRAGNEPAGNEPAGNEPAGNEPAGNEPAGNEPPDATGTDGDTHDSDDDIPTDDEFENANYDEDGDEEDAIPADVQGLKTMLTGYGLPARGSARSMIADISRHRAGLSERAAVEEAERVAADGAAAATGAGGAAAIATADDYSTRTRTAKQQLAFDKLVATIRYCADAIEKEPDVAPLRRLRDFAKLLNSMIRKASRERTGPNHRFMPQGLRDLGLADGDSGGGGPTGGAAGAGENEPLRIPLLQCHNVIRLCRRLMGGGNARNLRHICDALGIASSGDPTSSRTTAELKLRELHFEDYTGFVPSAEQLKLPLEAFNEQLGEIPLWSFDARAGGAHGNAYPETTRSPVVPWSEVMQMGNELRSFAGSAATAAHAPPAAAADSGAATATAAR